MTTATDGRVNRADWLAAMSDATLYKHSIRTWNDYADAVLYRSDVPSDVITWLGEEMKAAREALAARPCAFSVTDTCITHLGTCYKPGSRSYILARVF